MSLIHVILVILVVGIVVWLINTYVTIIDPKYKQLINIVAIVGVIIWLLWVLGIWQKLGGVSVPRVQASGIGEVAMVGGVRTPDRVADLP